MRLERADVDQAKVLQPVQEPRLVRGQLRIGFGRITDTVCFSYHTVQYHQDRGFDG